MESPAPSPSSIMFSLHSEDSLSAFTLTPLPTPFKKPVKVRVSMTSVTPPRVCSLDLEWTYIESAQSWGIRISEQRDDMPTLQLATFVLPWQR